MDTRISRRGWALAVCLFSAAAAFAQKPVPSVPPPPAAATAPKAAPPASKYADEAAVIERIRVGFRYEDDGSAQEVEYVRVHIQAQPAIQSWGQLIFNYNAATDKIHVDFVRVHKSGGNVVTAGPDAIQDLSSPVARIAPVYTDLRQIHVTVPDLGIGDTLEYQVTTQTIHPLIPGQFFLEWNFSKQVITLDETLDVNLPLGRAIKVKTSNGAAPPKIQHEGGRRTYSWHWSFTKRPEDSGNQNAAKKPKPPQFPDVALSTFDNWAQVGRWYATLERPRAAVTDPIRAEAATLVKGQSTDLGKVKAIYDYVSENIRYVSLSFGISQYQPHPAAQVLANQYGDCKDKATLFEALLTAEGIESYPVLINSGAKVDPGVPSPGQFDHLINIVVVDGKSYWADTTPGVTPFGFLLRPLRNKWALGIPTSGPPSLVRTPENAPFMPLQIVDVEGKVDSMGRLKGHLSMTFSGTAGAFIRATLRKVPQSGWPKLAESMVHTVFSSDSNASDPHFSDPADLDHPCRLDTQFSEPNAVDLTREDEPLSLPAGKVALADPAQPQSGETEPFKVGSIHDDTMRWKIVLPPQITASLPVPVHISRDYARYDATYSLSGHTLVAERHLILRQAKLPPSRYDDYEAFRAAVVADGKQQVTLTNSAPGLAAVPTGLSASDLLLQGYSAYQARNYAKAERFYTAAAAKNPHLPNLWNDFGLLYNSMGEYAKAVPALEKAIKANPYSLYAYNNLGWAYMSLGEKDAALSEFQKQVAINPLDQYAHAHIAQIYLSEKKYALAQPEFQTALKITPNSLSLSIGLGSAYFGLDQNDLALITFLKALDQSPSPYTWGYVTKVLAHNHSPLPLSEHYLQSAIRLAEASSNALSLGDTTRPSPDTPSLDSPTSVLAYDWTAMGWIQFEAGELEAAEPFLRSSWSLGDLAIVGDLLGRIYEKQGRRADAIRTYADALLCPNPPTEIRARLAALVGKKALGDAYFALASPHGLAGRRTLTLPNPARLSGTVEVRILVAPSAKASASGYSQARVIDARITRVISGSPKVRSAALSAIHSAKLPLGFPTPDQAKLLLFGAFSCSNLNHSCMLITVPAVIGAAAPRTVGSIPGASPQLR